MTSQPRTALLTAALRAANRDWRVFPLRPGDKRPAIQHWEERATTDIARIRACWDSAPYNIGIACGPSGLLVVDLDLPESRNQGTDDDPADSGRTALARLAATAGCRYPSGTYTVTTRTGGTHLYFAQPPDQVLRNTAGRLGPLIDTRGHGGYVVAAGSVVTGRAYTTTNDHAVSALPAWLAHALRRPTLPVPGGEPELLLDRIRDRSQYAAAALKAEVGLIRSAQPGARNHALNAAAYSLGRFVATGLLTPGETTTALSNAARANGLTDAEIAATIRSGLTAGAEHLRTPHPTPTSERRLPCRPSIHET